MKPEPENAVAGPVVPRREPWEDVVAEKVRRLRYGVVQIVVHEGVVTLVECTEKTRLAVGRRGRE